MELMITLTEHPKNAALDESKLGFGEIFTDHMFMMDWDLEQGWHDAKILPFADIMISPAATCLHYGQEVFEGLKAYRTKAGTVQLFRPDQNLKRMNASNQRVCMPLFDEAFVLEALKQLVRIDQKWVPHSRGASLYIRPFIFGTQPSLGVNPSTTYRLMIIMSPSGYYYAEGLAPINIHVETKYIRAAAAGGLGEAKTGGNYAASFNAQVTAKKNGYAQVLWLDSITRKNVEEVGAMNVFFVIQGKVITPALRGSILPGITRKSAIALLREWGYEVIERTISIDEIVTAHRQGLLQEAFGTGTAAIIAPIGMLQYGEQTIKLNGGQIGPISQKLFDGLTGIQFGSIPDPYGWTVTI